MDVINYLVLGLTGSSQLGGSSSYDTDSINLKDGLTLSELQSIDTNADGAITEEEFKQKFNNDSNYTAYWNAYKELCNASTTKTSSGTYESTQGSENQR